MQGNIKSTVLQGAQSQLDTNTASQMKGLYYFRTDKIAENEHGDNLPLSPTASDKRLDLHNDEKIPHDRKNNINNITSDAVNLKEVAKEDGQRASSLQSKPGSRTFKFRELNSSNSGKQFLEKRQTKRLSTPMIDPKSLLYQQYLSTGVSTPRSSLKGQANDNLNKNKNNNSEKPSTRGSNSLNQLGFNRITSLNNRIDRNNGFEMSMSSQTITNGDFTPKISNKSAQIGNITPNKMNQMSKSTSQGFGTFITPKISKQPLLYPYLSKREQDIMINQEKQMLLSSANKRYSVNTPFSNTYLNEDKEGNFTPTAANSQAFQRQKKAMLRIIAAEEKHTQSAQERGREERFSNTTYDNEYSCFAEAGIPVAARSKAGMRFTSRNPEGSYEQNQDQEEYQDNDEENNNNKTTNNSFDSLLDSPLSPPPKGSNILAEAKFRRSFNFISSGGTLNRKSFTRLPLRAATHLINPQQHQTPPSLMYTARQNQSQLPQISNTTSIHVPAGQNNNNNTSNNNIFADTNQLQQQQKSSVSLTDITPFGQRESFQNTGKTNNIFNVKSLRLTVPPQNKNNQAKAQTDTQNNELSRAEQQQEQQFNYIQLMATKEEDEDDQREIESAASLPSPNLLMKRKRIEESSKQENQLANLYMTSYKHIGEILEENSFFKVINSIEEDMLSTTIQNKALLPKKLGVLGTLRASIAQGKQIAENETAYANGFLNLIKSKRGLMQKQKLQLSRLNIGKAYAGMVAKALSHNDLAELKSINLSYNHFDGGAVFKIGNSLSESIQSIDLSNNSIGSSGTKGLIPLFDSKKFPFLRKLNLENNNIADIGLNTIIPSIFRNMSISVLNISHNKLSDASCTFIKKLLLNSSYLQELYLHWNKFSSYGGILIAQGLAENLNIKVLDLSHNGLGGVPKLRCGQKIIQSCNVLESAVRHLDLSYNQFSAQECQEIGETLKINHSLYGVHLEGNQCQALVDPRGFLHFPEKNETKHMSDAQIIIQRIHSIKTIGMNKLQSFDCKAFDNCWICHGWMEIRFEISSESSDLFTGEPVFLHLDFEDYQPIYMDADPEDKSKFFLYRMCPPNRKISFFFSDPCKNVLYTSKEYQLEDFKTNEHMNLKLEDIHTKEQEKPKQPQTQPVSDKKQGNNNAKDSKQINQKTNNKNNNKNNTAKGSKKKVEIVPPKQQVEVVSTSKQAENVSSKKQPELASPSNQTKLKDSHKTVTLDSQESGSNDGECLIEDEVMEALDEIAQVVPKKFKVKYLDGTVIQYHTPKYVNTIQTSLNRDIISKAKDYEPIIKAKPRQVETFFLITKSNLWHRGISLFRDYIPDSTELDKRCFEFDWVSSKLPKILEKGSDIGECKKILQSMYPMLRIAYKYLSSQGVTNDVFCITQNPFSTFAQRAQLIDNQLLYVRDIDFNFISASNIALKTKTYRNPDKALIRNEFLEIMGRIAMDKYIRNEKVKTNSEAIKLFFHEEGLLNHLYEFDSPQEWRNKRYWNQECDIKLKEQLPFIKSLYNMVADSRKNEKRYFTTIKSMSMAEFKDMVLKYDLLDDFLVERDIALSFNLAMMTQVDELTVDRHFQMTFVEFLEALARLAEKKSMTPLGEISDEYSVEERFQIKLHYKIESMIALIKKKQELLVLKENQGQKDQTQQQQAAGIQKDSNKRMSIQVPQMNARKSVKPTDDIPSTNFLRVLAQKQKSMNEFDDEKEKSKIQLKGVISKIMNKDMALPSALSPIPEDKANQTSKNFNLKLNEKEIDS